MDIRYKQQADQAWYAIELDWLLSPMNRLQDGRSLQSALIVALGSDALADKSDVLPDLDSTDRRGWWGDIDAEEIWGGWPVGSKLWLLRRAKITSSLAADGGTVFRAQGYSRQAVQPFVDRLIASGADVSAVRTDVNRIDVSVLLSRGPQPDVELRYAELWDELGQERRSPPGTFQTIGEPYDPELDFSDDRNSQYLAMFI